MSSEKSKYYDRIDLRLRTLIADRSQKDFALWLDEIPQKITSYLNGNIRPSWVFLWKLAQKGININWFLTGKGAVYVIEERSALTAEEQVFLHDLEEDRGITNREEALKAFRQLKDFQRNTNASESEMKIGLKILKITYGKKDKKTAS